MENDDVQKLIEYIDGMEERLLARMDELDEDIRDMIEDLTDNLD